jgi:serine/threonine protein kinase/tetratricopeptide (TPR) repeat protein
MEDVGSAPTVALAPLALRVGTVFADRFEVRALLGEGGMGAVYRAFDHELQEEVALKVLRREIADVEGTLDRFRREVKLARRVTHPNVARTYDLGSHEGTRFLTMELILGDPISRLVGKGKRPSLPEALRVVAEVARGLGAAHAAGVVHRDLKPDNIMSSAKSEAPSGDERIVITDFGIARLAEGAHGAEEAMLTVGAVLGTPAYMAPEQVEGSEIDGRADIYALGIVLFELLTGELPFRGDTIYALAAARLTSTPPDPRTHDPSIPEAVARLTLEAMARRREHRPDAQAMLQRIEALRGGAVAVLDRGARLPSLDLSKITHSTGPRVIAVAPIDAPEANVAMANDLTSALSDAMSSLRGIRLIPTAKVRATMAQHMSGGALDTYSMGRALQAEMVIDGSLRVAGGKARLRLRLCDIAKGAQTWAERIEGPVDDPFALEDETVRLSTEAVRARVTHDGQGPLDEAIREPYQRARAAYDRSGVRDLREAIAILEEANAKHPNDPWIMSLLGSALCRASSLLAVPEGNMLARAEELSIRALAADSTIGETFQTIALLRMNHGELRAAVHAFQDALARSPRLAEAHGNLGKLLVESGHVEEGMRRLDLAARLEPGVTLVLFERARTFALLGEKARAMELLETARGGAGAVGVIMLELRFVFWWRDRAWAAQLAERLERTQTGAAWDSAVPLLRSYGSDRRYSGEKEAFAYLTSSRVAPRRRALMHEIASEYYGAVDDREATLAHLEAAAELPFIDLLWLDHCPTFEAVRADPRFARVRAIASQRAADLWG